MLDPNPIEKDKKKDAFTASMHSDKTTVLRVCPSLTQFHSLSVYQFRKMKEKHAYVLRKKIF